MIVIWVDSCVHRQLLSVRRNFFLYISIGLCVFEQTKWTKKCKQICNSVVRNKFSFGKWKTLDIQLVYSFCVCVYSIECYIDWFLFFIQTKNCWMWKLCKTKQSFTNSWRCTKKSFTFFIFSHEIINWWFFLPESHFKLVSIWCIC